MQREQAEARIKAAAWTAAAEIGWREAIEMLQKAAREIEDAQWRGSGSR
jgi:hypothetical protein